MREELLLLRRAWLRGELEKVVEGGTAAVEKVVGGGGGTVVAVIAVVGGRVVCIVVGVLLGVHLV